MFVCFFKKKQTSISLIRDWSNECACIVQVVESGGKNIEIAVMTRENGLCELDKAEIDAIVEEIEAEKAAAEAAKKALRET